MSRAESVIQVDGFEELMEAMDMAEEDFDDEVQTYMMLYGEEALKEARSTAKENDWKDQTGNLRSSIGYTIFKDGNRYMLSSPEQYSGPKGNGAEGVTAAQQVGATPESSHAKWELKLYAAMDYASYVQDIHGKNVLNSATALLRDRMRETFGNQ